MPDCLRRIALASRVMSDLAGVWQQQNISLTTKIRLYSARVMSVLLYGAETWTLAEQEWLKFQAFYMNCHRHILDVMWYDFVTNESVCTTTGLADIRNIVWQRRLGLFGHIAPAASALDVCCNSKDFTPPDTTWRQPPRGRPRHSWLRQVCRDTDMSATDALTLAQDRDSWRAVTMASGLGAQ